MHRGAKIAKGAVEVSEQVFCYYIMIMKGSSLLLDRKKYTDFLYAFLFPLSFTRRGCSLHAISSALSPIFESRPNRNKALAPWHLALLSICSALELGT